MGSVLNIIVAIMLGLSFYLKSKIEDARLVKEYSNYIEYKNRWVDSFQSLKSSQSKSSKKKCKVLAKLTTFTF